MAANSTFVAENTEIGNRLSFSVRRPDSVTWDCSLPWDTLADAISTLTAAISAGTPSVTRGTTYQVVKEGVPARPKSKWQWLGIQSPGSFIDIYTDELPALVEVLTALSSETDTPLDLDASETSDIPQDKLPDYLQPAQLSATIASEIETATEDLPVTYSPLAQPRTITGTVPSGEFGWLSSDYGITAVVITVGRDGSVRGTVGINAEGLFDKFSTARRAPGNTYYVNVGAARTVDGVSWGAGSDSNNGTSISTPTQSIWKAIDLGRIAAHASGFKVNVLEGDYLNGKGIWDGTNAPLGSVTVDCALIAVGGLVLEGWRLSTVGTPSTHGTYTNCYVVSSTAPRVAVDRTHQDSRGVHRRYRQVTSASTCNSTPGTCYIATNDLYINPFPGVGAIRDANTYVHRGPARSVGAINFYMGAEPGASWECQSGLITMNPAAPMGSRKVAVISKVKMLYASSSAGTSDAFQARTDWSGLFALFDCEAGYPDKDGFNMHSSTATPSRLLTVNCKSYGTGAFLQSSCNAWTIHEDAEGVDVAGDYRESQGGTVHNINTSKAYMLGTLATDDYGDSAGGGSIPPTQFKAGDTAEIWIERGMAAGDTSNLAYAAAAGAAIYLQDPYPTPLPSSGTITVL